MKEKVVFTWSGGKDSAFALYEVLHSKKYEVVCLLTTITEDTHLVSMHQVRRELLERQAESLGIPLDLVRLPEFPSNKIYEDRMRDALKPYRIEGIRHVAFGDIFLEDLKQYRDAFLKHLDMEGVYPLWKRDTDIMARGFLDLGFKAVTVCVDSEVLTEKFVGRNFDIAFLDDLPPNVDPCGENGEFHTFVYDGRIFKKPIAYTLGEKSFGHNRFHFRDLVPI